MQKRLFLIVAIICMFISSNVTYSAQNNIIPGKAVSKKYGPFKVGFPSTKPIFIEIINYKVDDTQEQNWGDSPDNDGQTVIAMKVISDKGEILFRVNYPIIDEYDSINLYPKQINLPNKGALLLIYTCYNPSAEGTGVEAQFYGINQYGSFLPVTGVFEPGEEDEIRIIEQKIENKIIFCYVNLLSTGNFNVVQYYQIYPNGVFGSVPIFGKAEPITMSEYPVKIDEVRAEQKRKNGIIRLYTTAGNPSKGVKTIKVTQKSKVNFAGAKYDKTDEQRPWWLHVNIDGESGYLNNRKEIEVLGLPFIYREWDAEP